MISKKVTMKKLCFLKCNKCRQFKNPEILNVFNKILVISFICNTCSRNNEKILKEKESIKIIKIIWLKIYDYF